MKYHKHLPWAKALCTHEDGFYPIGHVKTAKIEIANDRCWKIVIEVDVYMCFFCGKVQISGLFKHDANCFRNELITEVRRCQEDF